MDEGKDSGGWRVLRRPEGLGWSGAMAHLRDDETAAKMGHPNSDLGHPVGGPAFARAFLLSTFLSGVTKMPDWAQYVFGLQVIHFGWIMDFGALVLGAEGFTCAFGGFLRDWIRKGPGFQP